MGVKLDFSGAGVNDLLNMASRGGMKITMVPFEDILPNERNHYTIEQIEALALSIADIGLRQPLEVKPEDENGKFVLIGGERRYTAIKMLLDQGDTRYQTVPCIISNPLDLDLPLSDESKELYALTTTNATQRIKTDHETMIEVENLRRIFAELKENGYTGSGRLRDLIAETLKISASQVQRLDFISRNLSPDLLEEFAEGKLPTTVAEAAAKLPEEKQAAVKKAAKGKKEITQKDVDRIAAQKTDADEDESPVVVDHAVVAAINKQLRLLEKGLKQGVTLSPGKNTKLLAESEKAMKALKAMQNILDEET